MSLKISTIKNDELDSSSDTVRLENVTCEKNEENDRKVIIDQNNKKLILEQDNSDHSLSNGNSSGIKSLKKKMSFVDLKRSFKNKLEQEEKVIDEQDRTITTTCALQ
jgi:hypothetical protein